METIDFNGVSLHRWKCGPSTFLARPELGARLMNWNIRMSDGSIRDVIHWPENANYDNFAKVRGGNPILFPFAARTFHKGKIGYWKDPSGAVRPMPQHGFAREGVFELTTINDTGFTAKFIPCEAAKEGYPYNYDFSVQYVFDSISLKVFFTLENYDEIPLQWSAGHHFYFTLPWHNSLTRNDYRFQVPAKKCFTHDPTNGALLPIKPFESSGSFGDPENSDIIYSKLTSPEVRFGPNGGEEDIAIRILNQVEDFPEALTACSTTASPWNAFVIWTENQDAPYYCIEPWIGPPNSPEHGKGLHTVNPNEKACFGVEVSLL